MVVVALATVAAGAGTMALFQDDETSSNNVTMGTLNLSVDGQNEAVQQLNVWGVEPNQTNASSILVSNDGSSPGYVDITIGGLVDEENGCVDPETEVDDTCGENEGELSDNLNVTVFFDYDNDNRSTSSNDQVVVENATLSNVTGQRYDTNYYLNYENKDYTHIRVRTTVPETAGNEIQTDAAEFNLTVHLDQRKDTGGDQ